MSLKASAEEARIVTETLINCLTELTTDVAETESQGVVEFTRAFVTLRQIKDLIEESLKPFDKFYEEVKGIKLPAAFEAHGVPTVTLEEGYRVTVAYNVRASVKGGQRDAAYQWLRDNGLGDIITDTVNASTLSALARSMAEENKELDTELFTVAILPTTSVTKTKK